jgi:hypothetical protein
VALGTIAPRLLESAAIGASDWHPPGDPTSGSAT